jgi:hypothetical protein
MLNQRSLEAVNAAEFTPPFIRPLYESHSFYRLPNTIFNLLTGEDRHALPPDVLGDLPKRYDTVILILVDAFGWRFIEERIDRYPFLQHVAREGVISKLTSMFPSTTAAHVTTVHTGLAPAQSGVYEWNQYEPALNALITPLMFSFAGENSRDTLLNAGLAPGDVFPNRTIYAEMAARGVTSCATQSISYARSAPSRHLFDGAATIPYRTLPEALVQLGQRMDARRGPAYEFLYFAHIDTLCHIYGPGSPEVEAEIDSLLVTLERQLLAPLLVKHPRALLLLTADHGMTEIDPATTLYLNRDEGLRGFRRFLALDRLGEPLVPAGSSRDLFLHTRPEALDEARDVLSHHLQGRAQVYPTSELVAQGFFGPAELPVSETFLRRVGNLMILPLPGESVYWFERGKFEQNFLGHHGGLTRAEMEIPLLALAL